VACTVSPEPAPRPLGDGPVGALAEQRRRPGDRAGRAADRAVCRRPPR